MPRLRHVLIGGTLLVGVAGAIVTVDYASADGSHPREWRDTLEQSRYIGDIEWAVVERDETLMALAKRLGENPQLAKDVGTVSFAAGARNPPLIGGRPWDIDIGIAAFRGGATRQREPGKALPELTVSLRFTNVGNQPIVLPPVGTFYQLVLDPRPKPTEHRAHCADWSHCQHPWSDEQDTLHRVFYLSWGDVLSKGVAVLEPGQSVNREVSVVPSPEEPMAIEFLIPMWGVKQSFLVNAADLNASNRFLRWSDISPRFHIMSAKWGPGIPKPVSLRAGGPGAVKDMADVVE